MRRFILLAVCVLALFATESYAQTSNYTIELARSFSKDIFDLNGVPYLSPMVESVNATSNARFYSSAYVPRENKFRFKFTVNVMTGFVPDNKKEYAPQYPTQKFQIEELASGKYGTININPLDPSKSTFNITDTAGLINYLFKTVLYDGVTAGSLRAPASASTLLGKDTTQLRIDNAVLQSLITKHPIYAYLPKEMQETLLGVITSIPGAYTLPAGGNINTIIAGVPQLEFGSIYGTDFIVRFIPPLDMGEYIGKFAFWGLGIRHNLSQYFYNQDMTEEQFRNAYHAAFMMAYQGTHLTNKIGVTGADLDANAKIFNANVHFSKTVKNWFEVFAGVSYEYTKISADFKYYLPIETQLSLGMRQTAPDPTDPTGQRQILLPATPEFPGDTKPQKTYIAVDDSRFKFTLGMRKEFGPISIFADYSTGDFNIISGGLEYRIY